MFLKHFLSYLIILVVFFAIDLVWIAVVAKKFYRDNLGFLMKKKTGWLAAIVFYLIYIFGLLYFVVNPALAMGSGIYALYTGAIFGFIAYATYDLTNLATVKDWPLKLTIVDLVWGSTLSAGVCIVSYYIILALLY